jgi:phenylalanyl-tRNA synthetase alpha chain
MTLVEYATVSFFINLGFHYIESSEIDTSWFCFDSLNIPTYHPSRGASDTFYIENSNILSFSRLDPISYNKNHSSFMMRTQTSSVQIKSLLSKKIPLKTIALGKVFRNDNIDSTHNINFSQIEVLSVDLREEVNVNSLYKFALKFMSHFFSKNKRVRFRNSFFPFTTPSFEVDIMDDVGN